jgi:Ca2+-binding RTX toxin-like protein
MRRTLLLAALVVAAAPATAQAATVTASPRVVDEGGLSSYVAGTDVLFQAAPGEVNDATFTYDADGVTIVDAGAALTVPMTLAGPTCVAQGPSTVRCPLPLRLTVKLGDGNDRATVVGGLSESAIDGEAGDDVIVGGGGNNFLTGGAGSDQVTGGPRDDVIYGAEAAPAADTYDGGGGTDTLDYGPVTAPVRVDLARRVATGTQIGTDTLTGLENATGGRGDDRLVGDAGPNELVGGRGADTLLGGAGDDILRGEQLKVGQPGYADTIDAGPGDDQIWLARGQVFRDIKYEQIDYQPDGKVDRVRCGSGRDTVSYAGLEDVLPTTCERVSSQSIDDDQVWLELPPLGTTRRALTLATSALGGRPFVRSPGGVILARATRRFPKGRVTLALTPAGQRLAERGRPVVVQVRRLAGGPMVGQVDVTVALPRL